jgi:hypothetical protein
VLDRTVERAKSWASRLLSEDSVFEMVQRGLHSTLRARQLFERNVGRILAGANIPSRRDLDRLEARVEEIDREVEAIVRRLERIKSRLADDRRRSPTSTDAL